MTPHDFQQWYYGLDEAGRARARVMIQDMFTHDVSENFRMELVEHFQKEDSIGEETRKRIIRMRLDGETYSEIVRLTGLPGRRVRAIITEEVMKLNASTEKPVELHYANGRLLSSLGIEQRHRIVALAVKGMADKDISEETGVSEDEVNAIIYEALKSPTND